MTEMNKAVGNMVFLIYYNIFPSLTRKINLTVLKFGLEIFSYKCPVSAFSHFEKSGLCLSYKQENVDCCCCLRTVFQKVKESHDCLSIVQSRRKSCIFHFNH